MDSYDNLSKLGVDLNEPLTTQTLVTAISSLYDLFLQEKQHREELQEQIFEQKERWKKIVQPQIESLLDSVDDLVEQLETFNDDILSLNQKNASLTEFVNIEKTTVHDDIAVLQDKIDEIQSKLFKQQQQQQLSQTQTQHQGPFTAPGGTSASGTSTSGVSPPLPRQTGGLTSSSKQMLSRLVSNISGQRLQPTVVNKRDNPHDMLRPMDRPGRKLYTRSQLYSYRPSPVDTAKYITFTSFQSDFEQSKNLYNNNDNDNADNNNNNNSITTDSENNPENCEENNCKIETKKDIGNDNNNNNNNNNPEQSKEFVIYLPRELSVGDESQHNVETLSSNHAKQIGIVSNKNPYSTDHNRDTAHNNYHQNTTSSQKWGKYSQDERQMIQNQYNNQHNRSTTSYSAYHILQNGGNNTMNNNQNNTKKNSSSSYIETDMWRRVEPLPEEIEHHKNPLFQTFYSPTQNPEESVDDDNSSSSKLTKQTLWLNDNLSQMQILLNKLTPQKVETFSTKIISIISFHDEIKGAYADELQLSCFVHLIVNRSLKEAQLVPTYAKLSQLIATSPELKEFTFQTCNGENALYSPQLASKSIPLRFRVCLVLYCQYLLVQYINYKKSKFISNKEQQNNQEGQDEHQNDDNVDKLSQDSKELNKAVYEQQSITDSRKGRNFCHFIAELYLQGLLGLGPCMEAVSCLLQSHDEDDIVVVLDFFTGLIKSTSPNTSKFPLKTYMDKLEEIKNTKQLVFIAEDKTQHCQPLQNRTRFLIMDVLDLWDKKCKNTNK